MKLSAATERKLRLLKNGMEKMFILYSENIITVPEERKWDYAIPENYTNFCDGFLYQTTENHRGMPLINYDGKILYLFKSLDWCYLKEDEAEKHLLFDRHGKKYTFIVKRSAEEMESNPSYFDFLPRVKKYERKYNRIKQLRKERQ